MKNSPAMQAALKAVSEIKTQHEQLRIILDDHGFDFIDASEVEQWHFDGDDMDGMLQDRITEQEIIYYHVAMEYLSVEDPSLAESFALAAELCMDIADLNSEKLATIHYQNALSEKICDLAKALDEFEFVKPDEVEEE